MAAISVKFGLVLKQQREKAGFSQEYIALQSGLDRSFVSMLERGKKATIAANYLSSFKALSMRPSELVALVENGLD